MGWRHEPVLLDETLAFLVRGPGLYLDATLGLAGHARALLEREPGARLLGCDRDPFAIAHARRVLAPFGDRVTIAQAAFRELPRVHAELGGEPFTGALLDLGVSSPQIDDPARGLSFTHDGPLDMRMDPTRGIPLAEVLAAVEPEELADVLRRHGDVRPAARLARDIVAEARRGSLPTTRALVAVIDRALGGRPHPSRYAPVFQALRIWVNEESQDLEAVLEWLPGAMAPGGVVVTLAYHSGEDRLIKRALRGAPVTGRARKLPVAGDQPERPWQELTKKVVKPSPSEQDANPRARSARLRAFRRTSP